MPSASRANQVVLASWVRNSSRSSIAFLSSGTAMFPAQLSASYTERRCVFLATFASRLPISRQTRLSTFATRRE